MIRNSGWITLLSTTILVVLPLNTWGADRGRLLYENHCVACHESTVHIREKRAVKKFTDIEKYARRFSTLAGVEWSDAELLLVVSYLNRKYYKFSP